MKTSIWKLKKANHIIVVKADIIYKGFLKENQIKKSDPMDLSAEELKNFFSIPYSYIRKVENKEHKNTLNIYFGEDSEEDFTFENEKIKNEFFDYLKKDSGLYYSSKTPSKLSYAKAQFFALGILSFLYFWSLYLAIQIENGVLYKIIGSGNPGISGIVLGIANFGSIQISVAFICILFLLIYNLRNKLKSRTETAYLTR